MYTSSYTSLTKALWHHKQSQGLLSSHFTEHNASVKLITAGLTRLATSLVTLPVTPAPQLLRQGRVLLQLPWGKKKKAIPGISILSVHLSQGEKKPEQKPTQRPQDFYFCFKLSFSGLCFWFQTLSCQSKSGKFGK